MLPRTTAVVSAGAVFAHSSFVVFVGREPLQVPFEPPTGLQFQRGGKEAFTYDSPFGG